MSYIGVAVCFILEVFYLIVPFQRHKKDYLFKTPIRPFFWGVIIGVAMLVVCVGPFLLFKAPMPKTPYLVAIVVLSAISLTLYHWAPVALWVSRMHKETDIKYRLLW